MDEVVVLTRGYRYRLAPTVDQSATLAQFAGVTRLIYNLALEQRRDFWRQYHRAHGFHISFASQGRELTELRDAYDWVAAVPAVAGSYALRDLDTAYQAFFDGRTKYPTPRRKGLNDTFRVQGRDVVIKALNRKWSAVRVPKLGWLKFRVTRPMVGKVRNVNFSCVAGEWSVAFACEREAVPARRAAPSVGIDRGIAQTLTLSTGEHVQAPGNRRLIARRKLAQRRLSRMKVGSARRFRQRHRIADLSAKAARVRVDWCHRTSTQLANRFGIVAVEALDIKRMTASARGTVAEPGRMVRQKAGLNRSILEQSWGKLAQFLDYKLTERGGHLISVPAAYTSQTCASCGVVDARSRKSQAVFACVHCDHTDNADVNAAKEILRRSTAWLDVEGRFVGPPKRQPGATRTGFAGAAERWGRSSDSVLTHPLNPSETNHG